MKMQNQLFPGFQKSKVEVINEKGLLKSIDKKGKGNKPSFGSRVSVLYKGWMSNGQYFDGNQNRKHPYRFKLGTNTVIPGFQMATASMQLGEKARFYFPSEIAYGGKGFASKIPPNTDLVFSIQLLSALPPLSMNSHLIKNPCCAAGFLTEKLYLAIGKVNAILYHDTLQLGKWIDTGTFTVSDVFEDFLKTGEIEPAEFLNFIDSFIDAEILQIENNERKAR